MRDTPLPKMMLGFVVRRCAVAIGHDPTPAEFAAWANAYRDDDRHISLFGRPITEAEARVILRHRGRPVAARSAKPHEVVKEQPEGDASVRVISLAAAAARARSRSQTRRGTRGGRR